MVLPLCGSSLRWLRWGGRWVVALALRDLQGAQRRDDRRPGWGNWPKDWLDGFVKGKGFFPNCYQFWELWYIRICMITFLILLMEEYPAPLDMVNIPLSTGVLSILGYSWYYCNIAQRGKDWLDGFVKEKDQRNCYEFWIWELWYIRIYMIIFLISLQFCPEREGFKMVLGQLRVHVAFCGFLLEKESLGIFFSRMIIAALDVLWYG